MARAEGDTPVFTSAPACPVLEIGNDVWAIARLASLSEHPSWSLSTMYADDYELVTAWRGAIARADNEAMQAEQDRARHAEAIRRMRGSM